MTGFFREFWEAVLRQDREAIRGYFCPEAEIRWHCTNEAFTPEEFIRANCDYPGSWEGEVQRQEELPGGAVTVTLVREKGGGAAFHAVSFFRLREGKILSIDEYWGDDGPPPSWRREMGLGRPIL